MKTRVSCLLALWLLALLLERAPVLLRQRWGLEQAWEQRLFADPQASRLQWENEVREQAEVRRLGAASMAGVDVAEALERQWQAWQSGFVGGETDKLQRLRWQGWTLTQWRQRLENEMRGLVWLEHKAGKAPLEAAAQDWFRQQASAMRLPARYRVSHLFLSRHGFGPAQRQQRIAEVQASLQGGADWAEAVARFSEDERSSGRAGDLGWLQSGRLPADFANAVESLKLQQITGPVATALGWHWLRLEQRREPRPLSFDEVREELLALMDCRRRTEVLKALLQGEAACQIGASSRLEGP